MAYSQKQINDFLQYYMSTIIQQDSQANQQNPPQHSNNPIAIDFDKVVADNIPKLQEWTPFKTYERIYDSKTDCTLNSFVKAVMHKENVFVILNDTFGNVFGGFAKRPIVNLADTTRYTENYDVDHYLFVLFRDGRNTEQKMFRASQNGSGFFIYSNGTFWLDIGNHLGRICVTTPGTNQSYNRNLKSAYQGIEETDVNGLNGMFQTYTVDRIIVLKTEI
ncbi:hypothetical protein EIN_178360 [Entamoeba invadens IP1]|uniref:hypothetical protein n=1 Tax=Entamoeba invadens IP1 TaxID=370355 RepID=UPI0002C3CEDA|nr:hypothetical protein EIN_178360 [Entamoeba invadens IP1]ELP93899.1 hypothetical protein EIN_178360 [Entamoeba invadens IP1]|eukprot:XP_004260670.1 hypothetical protein EIN_178360 [Entamoeba invadens IP1]